MKKKKLLTALTIISIVLIAGCQKDDFAGNEGVCPIVVSTNPLKGASNVPLNQIITATFNEKMDPETITEASFTLQGATTMVTGTISYTDLTASFAPSSPLTPNTTYTGRIKTLAKDLNGNALQTDYVWTFSTDASPTVISTDPENNATGVALNKSITAKFSVPMDSLTLTSSTFTIKEGATAVAGIVSYADSTATFIPTSPLSPNTLYTGTITTGAKNIAGTPLVSNYVWTFTTVSPVVPVVISTDPADNATGVVLNKTVTATFSMLMDPSTLTGITFILKQGTTFVPGIVSLSGTTVSFNPTSNLAPNTFYTGTITTGAKNIAGTPLAANYVWTFTTAEAVAPTVISTDPANSATGVVLDKTVTATFSMLMDPSTLTGSTFTIKQGTTSVAGTVSFSGSTVSFNPSSNLTPNTLYTGTITTGAKNIAGTPLAANYVWTFTTAAAVAPTVISTDPTNNATGVVLNKTVTALFSVPMDPLTLTGSTFTIKQGTTSVAGSVSFSGSTATFNPTSNLAPNTLYTGTITTGAKNIAGTPLAANYVWTFTTVEAVVPTAPFVDLKTAGRFGILAATTVTNDAGFSVINNLDVGIYPGTAVTGFPPATIIGGAIYTSTDASPIPAMLAQAKLDLTEAYLFAESASSPAPVTVSGNQGGKTLAPGIYKSTSTLSISSGNLTLDAQGNANAVWIFQIASAFTTVGGTGNGNVILTGGAQAKNIFWQVGSSATIGNYTSFYGNIIALTSITMGSNSTAVGRMLARNGAVVMTSTNTITKP